jgi:hypothetical protein
MSFTVTHEVDLGILGREVNLTVVVSYYRPPVPPIDEDCGSGAKICIAKVFAKLPQISDIPIDMTELLETILVQDENFLFSLEPDDD